MKRYFARLPVASLGHPLTALGFRPTAKPLTKPEVSCRRDAGLIATPAPSFVSASFFGFAANGWACRPWSAMARLVARQHGARQFLSPRRRC
jgi:hypothetical protein